MADSLGVRLGALAALVPAGPCVADIGTDHALLPAWLVRQGRVERAVGVDRAAAALASARPSVAGLPVELRLGDGFAGLGPTDAHAVVIAGMGAERMVGILDVGVPASVRRLVLQPTDAPLVLRRWLVDHGWDCVSEALVEERGRVYFTSAWEHGEGVWDEADLAFGREVRRAGGAVFLRWLARESARLERVSAGLRRARRVDAEAVAAVMRARVLVADEARRFGARRFGARGGG